MGRFFFAMCGNKREKLNNPSNRVKLSLFFHMVLEFVFPCVVLTEFISFLHVKPEPSAKDFVFKKSFKIFFFSCVELRKINFRRIFFHFHFSRKMFQKKTLFFQERFFNVWNWVRKKNGEKTLA